MIPRLYDDLASWYRMVDPLADHEDEGAWLRDAFERAIVPPAATLLELGAGAGNNAFYLSRRFACTLTDRSPRMLALSREVNPGSEHCEGDMRTLRLGRTFDAVLVHDAVMYLTSAGDLAAAARTAFEHTRPGGAAIFAPDCTRETFREWSAPFAAASEGRALRGFEWTWDPDPADDTFVTDMGLALREAGEMHVVHDRHVEGLFGEATWRRALAAPGFGVERMDGPADDGWGGVVFVCRRR